MKKILFWTLALAIVFVGSTAMAQGMRRGGQRMDAESRAQNMTENMVRQYSLNEKQQKKLLKVNKSWTEKMDSYRGDRQRNGVRPTQEERDARFAQMKKERDSYDAKVKKIMTQDQYDSYLKNRANRPMNNNGMMNGRRNNNNGDCPMGCQDGAPACDPQN